jgi:hypothetical protein
MKLKNAIDPAAVREEKEFEKWCAVYLKKNFGCAII